MISSQAAEISIGTDIAQTTSAMKEAGYSSTGLDMGSADRDTQLAFWSVEEGVLIVGYSLKTKKVIGVSYWLSDERPKATRKTFDMEVKSFDTETGVMTVQTKQPKREQGGADRPATAPVSKSEGSKKPKPESEERSQ